MTTQQQALQDVTAIVQDFIARGETFTSAHVTMACRSNSLWAGTLGHERGVAPMVREIFTKGDMTGYGQTMVGSFFAYHPDGQDPSSVDLRLGGGAWLPRVDRANFTADGDPTSGPAPTSTPGATPNRSAVPLAAAVAGTDPVDGQQVRVEYNAQGYAQIPRSFTAAIGLANGDGVTLEGTQLGGSVVLKAADSDDPIARLQQASGALRLRDRSLMPFGVGLHNDVALTLDLTAQTLTLT